MKDILFSDNFRFFYHKFENAHYTDSRKGAPMHFLAYMEKGSAKLVAAHKTVLVRTGDVFYIPRGLPYQSYWYTEGEGTVNFLSFGFLELFAKESAAYDLQKLALPEQTVRVIRAIPTGEGQVSCRTLSLFYGAMAEVLPHLSRSKAGKDERLLAQIKACIAANPHAPMSKIAAMCALSEPRLYAIFSRNSDTTPNEYRCALLCKRAVTLLLTTDQTVEDIAEQLGFSSASYFRKTLKKYTALTPREIRRKSRSL